MTDEAQAKPADRSAPEFLAPLTLLAVALFALNNQYLKAHHPSFITGKLSDFTACFFLPLFFSAWLGWLTPLAGRARLRIGVLVTLVGFSAVKLSPQASAVLDASLGVAADALGWRRSHNLVDPSDLMALPMVIASYAYGLRRLSLT